MAGSGDGSELPTVSGRGANREIGVASPYPYFPRPAGYRQRLNCMLGRYAQYEREGYYECQTRRTGATIIERSFC